jgi:hypothetical protein
MLLHYLERLFCFNSFGVNIRASLPHQWKSMGTSLLEERVQLLFELHVVDYEGGTPKSPKKALESNDKIFQLYHSIFLTLVYRERYHKINLHQFPFQVPRARDCIPIFVYMDTCADLEYIFG